MWVSDNLHERSVQDSSEDELGWESPQWKEVGNYLLESCACDSTLHTITNLLSIPLLVLVFTGPKASSLPQKRE